VDHQQPRDPPDLYACLGGYRRPARGVPYRRVWLDLRVHAAECRDLVGGRSPFAPGLLRQTTLEFVRHPVGLATPYRAAARGQPPTQPPADIAKLCPRAVVW